MIQQSQPIEWGIAQVAQEGQKEPGDRFLVAPFSGGVLISVIDGLGHGPKAAIAAEAAVAALEPNVGDDPIALMEYCHQQLTKTRGVVLSIASIDTSSNIMTWLGVGNVNSVLLRTGFPPSSKREHLHLRGGIVGYRLPPLRAFQITVRNGDTLIFATDGIRSGFTDYVPTAEAPQDIADYILEHHSRGTDDALVLVARYTVTNTLQDEERTLVKRPAELRRFLAE